MKIGYYIKARDDTIEDTIAIIDSNRKEDLRALAEQAIRCYWSHRGNWDRLNSLVLTLVIDGKEQGDFEIEMYPGPVFIASELKEEEPK